jgi:4-methyl-5(b-hydroxyethyl)-thiazole monophosphate biosynthesis
MKRVYILLAQGFECVEALAPIDVLFRAGVKVVRVAVGESLDVESSHGLVTLHCDILLRDANFDDGIALILPGGNPGYINLRNSEQVCHTVREFYTSGRLVGAICGAPTLLAAANVARGSRITCHSSVIAEMGDYRYVGDSVVEEGNLITAAGAGISIDFALAVAHRLVDSETLSRTRQGMEL